MEFAAEPTANDVHRYAAAGKLIQGGKLFGSECRIPRTGQDGDDELPSLGSSQKRVAKKDWLVLIFSAIARRKTDLA